MAPWKTLVSLKRRAIVTALLMSNSHLNPITCTVRAAWFQTQTLKSQSKWTWLWCAYWIRAVVVVIVQSWIIWRSYNSRWFCVLSVATSYKCQYIPDHKNWNINSQVLILSKCNANVQQNAHELLINLSVTFTVLQLKSEWVDTRCRCNDYDDYSGWVRAYHEWHWKC